MWSFASSTRPPPNSLAHIPLKVTAPSPAGIAALGTAALQGSMSAGGWRRSAPPASPFHPLAFRFCERPAGERLVFKPIPVPCPGRGSGRGAKGGSSCLRLFVLIVAVRNLTSA
jgi:hypothetical protein